MVKTRDLTPLGGGLLEPPGFLRPKNEEIPRLGRSFLPLVAVLALLPYVFLPSLPMHGDTWQAITNNQAVQSGSLAGLFTVDFWGLPADASYGTRSYRPLVSLTYALQARLYGNSPALFHLTDMLFHSGGAVLLALILFTLQPGSRWNIPAACIFAVHPIVSEAVCSVVGRADLMASLAFLGMLYSHLAARRSTRPWAWEAGALGLFVLGLLSKEYAVAFPFMLMALDGALRWSGKTPGAQRRRQYFFWALSLALLAGYLALRLALIGALGGVPMLGPGDQPLVDQPWTIRWATAAWLFANSFRLLLVPIGLNYFYGPGTIGISSGFFDPKTLAGLAVLAGLAFAALRPLWRRRDVVPLVAVSLFFFPLAPSLNTVSIAGILFAERFLYLPAAGMAVFLAWALERRAERRSLQMYALAGVGLLTALLAVLTFLRVEDWRSTEALARQSLRWYPRGSNSLFEVGIALGVAGKFEQAADYLGRALDTEGRNPKTWKNYGVALHKAKRYQEAATAWRKAIEFSSPDLGLLWQGLGHAELEAGRFEEAVRSLSQARKLMPGDQQTAAWLARALIRLGQKMLLEDRAGEAAELARRSLELGQMPPEGTFLAGMLLARAGRQTEAREAFRKALTQDADLLRKKHQVAVDLDNRGLHLEAAEQFKEILAATPDHIPTLFNAGRCLLLAGKPGEAVNYLEAGLALKEDPAARRFLLQARAARDSGQPVTAAGALSSAVAPHLIPKRSHP